MTCFKSIRPLLITSLFFIIVPFYFSAQVFAQDTDLEIAKSFFPQWLIDEELEISQIKTIEESAKWISPVSADLDITGKKDYLIVAYGLGGSGGLRVINKTLPKPALIAEIGKEFMIRDRVEVLFEDLDGDNSPEIILEDPGRPNTGTGYWVFKWTHKKLVPMGVEDIGLSRDGKALSTHFSDAQFIDLDFDTIPEIISEDLEDTNYSPPLSRYSCYKLIRGDYQKIKSFDYFKIIKSDSYQEDGGFSLSSVDSDYILTVNNGSANGKNQASDAVISINDTVVVSSQNFLSGGRSFSIPVKLKEQNNISYKVTGGRDSFIIVSLGSILPRKPLNPVYILKMEPRSIPSGKETAVTFEVMVRPSPDLQVGTIKLNRYENQEFVSEVSLFDDGTHGDKIKGDNIYTIQIGIKEIFPKNILFTGSAAYDGVFEISNKENLTVIRSSNGSRRTSIQRSIR